MPKHSRGSVSSYATSRGAKRPSRRERPLRRVVPRKSASGTGSFAVGVGPYPNELALVKRMAVVPRQMPEAKYITSYYTAQTIGNTGANGAFIWSPTLPAQSTTVSTRIGDKIKMMSLVIKGYFLANAATAGSSTTVVRTIAFKSEDPGVGSYTATGLEALFWDNNSANSFTNSLYYPSVDAHIIHDRTTGFTTTGNPSATVASARIWPIDVQVECNQLIKFAPTTQTARSGGINVYMVSNSAVSTDVVFNGSIRAYYQDA